MKNWLSLFSVAFIGGFIGFWLEIPVGALLGALLFVAAFQMMKRSLPKIPAAGKRAVQVVLGANIGLSFSSETLMVMKEIWLPALLIPLFHLAIGILLGGILIRFLKIDPATAFCSAIPAGMSEIAFLAEAHNAQLPLVVTIHICRVFFLVITIPFVVYLIL